MAVNLSPVGGVAVQFFTNSGAVLTGGKIFTYAAGTTTPQTTFTNASGSVPHSNPIILDASGRVPSGEIWLTDGFVYKFLLKDANDVLIGTYDNIIGINSNFVNFTNQQEFQTATAGQTVFTLTTTNYQPGTNSLSVFVDGVNQYGPGAQYAYLETNSTTVTFISGLHVGAEVKFTTSQINSSAATSADQVSYLPAGVGAVPTNVQAKLRQTVSVMDFGAVGDGVADDTAAIQAALSSATNLDIRFPSGVYVHTGISASNLTSLTVVGDGATLFLANGSDVRAFETTDCDYVEISGLTIDGNQNNQTISGTRLNGAGIVINNALTVIIQNNTIKNVSTGASIVLNSADPFAVDTTTESVLIDNNTIRDSGFTGAPFTCDGIYCQYDNARITNNKIFNSTDFGVALEYSIRSVVSNNLVYNAEVGLGGVGVDSCVFSDNTITDCLFRGIFFSTGGQAISAPWISYRTVIANNVVNGVSGSALPGNTFGIQVDYGSVETDFVVSNNFVNGADYGIGVSTNNCLVANNSIKNSTIRGLLIDGTLNTNVFGNVFDDISLPNIESIKTGQVNDVAGANIQSRLFRGSSGGAGIIYRACYIKTDNTTDDKVCVVSVTATADVSGVGLCATTRQMSIKSVAGTLTITDVRSYSGDITNLEISIGQNGAGIAEVLIGNALVSVNCDVIVQLMALDPADPFYIQEV
jgi:parallel beta-helix repeat protein